MWRTTSTPALDAHLLIVMLLAVLVQLGHRASSTAPADGPSVAQMFHTVFRKFVKAVEPVHELGPDAFADPPEFIRARKFVPEVHKLTTSDGYELTMHRVINPLVPRHLRHRLKPVLLQHGLFTSAFNFLLASDRNNDRPKFNVRDLDKTAPTAHLANATRAPPNHQHWWELLWSSSLLSPLSSVSSLWTRLCDWTAAKWGLSQFRPAKRLTDSLAFAMANQGYDVWLANSRGTTYSLNHTRYNHAHDWRYWDFSFHEIGLYDLPAQIGHILRLRKRRSLAYIGHSQGNLAMFVLQSLQPHWAHKVKPFIAMAPIAFIPQVYFGAMRLFIQLIEATSLTTTRLNQMLKGPVGPKHPATQTALAAICAPKHSTAACNMLLTLTVGSNPLRQNSTLTPIVMQHIPEGTSALNMLHFGQMIVSGQFRAFDFGHEENLLKYGTHTNPFYPIHNILSRDIAFVKGRTDTLSTMQNARITKSMLPVPLISDYTVDDPLWGHSDYMYAIGSGILANEHMIGLCDQYRLVD